MLSATFSPALLRLAPGRYHWQVRSLVGTVEDRLPDSSEVTLDIAVSTEPAARLRCFGAASRDPLRRCVNRKLRTAIVPPPEDAIFSQNSPCTPLSFEGVLGPCEFGVPAASARATVALVGDSHASHWRAALEYVAQRKRWRGVSITRSGCPLMCATTQLAPARPGRVPAVERPGAAVVRQAPDDPHGVRRRALRGRRRRPATARSELDTKVAGFHAAWKALPATVKRIVVIRDTPIVGFQANECVRKAKAKRATRATSARSSAARRCARTRRSSPRGGCSSPRVKVIDMTRYLCSKKRCFPVIGGALVYKDDQHMTDVFATTLGPFLRRADRQGAVAALAARGDAQRRPKFSDSVQPAPMPLHRRAEREADADVAEAAVDDDRLVLGAAHEVLDELRRRA